MLKFVALSTLLVVANAGLLPTANHATLTYAAEPVHLEQHEPAQYDFKYSVNDPHTGDVKEQQESRRGDNVEGYYSLVEADGGRRTVQYTADAHNGFNAVVHREESAHHAAPVAIAHAAPVAYAQHKLIAPVAYAQHQVAAPIAYTQHQVAAPIAYTQHQVAAPIAYTQHHHAQPIAVAHSAPIAYTQHHHAQPIAVTHSAPIAYTQHHHAQPIAVAHSAPLRYTQHHVATYAAPLSHHQLTESHGTITHHGNQQHY